jgi:hypothetical protein
MQLYAEMIDLHAKETLVSFIIQNSVKETRFTSLYRLAIDTLSFFILTCKSACNKDDSEQSNMIVIYNKCCLNIIHNCIADLII